MQAWACGQHAQKLRSAIYVFRRVQVTRGDRKQQIGQHVRCLSEANWRNGTITRGVVVLYISGGIRGRRHPGLIKRTASDLLGSGGSVHHAGQREVSSRKWYVVSKPSRGRLTATRKLACQCPESYPRDSEENIHDGTDNQLSYSIVELPVPRVLVFPRPVDDYVTVLQSV